MRPLFSKPLAAPCQVLTILTLLLFAYARPVQAQPGEGGQVGGRDMGAGGVGGRHPSFLRAGSGLPLPDHPTKIDAQVLAQADQGPAESLVVLSEQADLSGADALPTRAEKGAYVYARLSETAHRSQAPLLAYLQSRGIEHRSLWIANLVWVRADLAALQAIAARPEVARLAANLQVQMELPDLGLKPQASMLPDYPTTRLQDYSTTLWNLEKVRAPEVWAAGVTGEGVVVGGQDTGYDWTHPALKNAYRGWDGAISEHDYNWFDAVASLGGADDCEGAPCDPYGHGTHTMGIMVGDDGAGAVTGMAPGASWIGCRNMDANGVGSPLTYLACYQWFVAPTLMDGSSPRPDLAPDVINNSWSCPDNEGCTDPEILRSAVQNVRAAGILTVHSAGNNGPECGTVNEPAAIYPESFTVSNTQPDDTLSPSSSRGPHPSSGSDLPRPDIAAPGTSIYSSVPGGYSYLTGTSMAAPHVAGLAALVLSANPALSGQVDQIEQVIQQSAVQPTAPGGCSLDGQSPNSDYGWGRIDALAAVQHTALSLSKTASLPAVQPGQQLTYTLTVAAGLSAEGGLVLSDALPAQTTLLSASQPYTLAGGVLTWNLPDLAAGASTSVQFTVLVDLTAGGAIANTDYSVASGSAVRYGLPVVTPVVRWYYYPLVGR